MPVDLTENAQLKSLRASIVALQGDRDCLEAQVADVSTLYEELYVRDERIIELAAKLDVALNLAERVDTYEQTLNKIVAARGRGALKLAQQALA